MLVARLNTATPETGRLHTLWALDAIGGEEPRRAIRSVLSDSSPRVRVQAARSAGIRRDRSASSELVRLLSDRDTAVRREAAIALGRLGELSAAGPLYAALGDADAAVAWSVRQAIRLLEAWDKSFLLEALLDERRLEPALRLADEAWADAVVEALTEALKQVSVAPVRGRIIALLGGLYRRYPEWSGGWFGKSPLEGPFPQKTADWSPPGMKRVLDGLAIGLADPDSSVRFQAIVSASQVGIPALAIMRRALAKEAEPTNQALLGRGVGRASPTWPSAPILIALAADPARSEPVRLAALGGLARFRDPQSLRARLSLVYDSHSPPALVARALPDLAHLGFLPPNELASFLESPAPEVRAAAVLSLNVKKKLPADLTQSILERLVDPSPEVREAAMLAVAPLQFRVAIPRLIEIANDRHSPDRSAAMEALCGMPDPRAYAVYLAAINDGNPRLLRLGESALLEIKDRAGDVLVEEARSGKLTPAAALVVDRVLTRFQPIKEWRVIGPFPDVIPPGLFTGRSIDWGRVWPGAAGVPVKWVTRRSAIDSGRIDLEDLKRVRPDHGGFGFDSDHSPNLGAFAYAEVVADADRTALLLLGSSGTMSVTVNGRTVYDLNEPTGRGFAPETDTVRIDLKRGTNRVLVFCRQGAGAWAFSAQIGGAP